MTLQERIAEALRLEAMATKGPWLTSDNVEHSCCWDSSLTESDFLTLEDGRVMTWRQMIAEADAKDTAFIAAARNLVKPLAEAFLQQAQDWATADTAIREACRKVLGDAVDGDSVAVPPVEDLVERVVAECNRLAAVDSRMTTYEAIETAAEKFYGDEGYRWSHGEALMDLVEDAAKWKARVAELEAELAKERA